MAKHLTKTFTEARYWRRAPSAELYQWVEIPRSQTGEIPLDAQVREWVERTGAAIVHPGQLGIYGQWLDATMTIRYTQLGLTVLYVESSNAERQPYSPPDGSRPDYRPERGGPNEPECAFPPPEPPATDSATPYD